MWPGQTSSAAALYIAADIVCVSPASYHLFVWPRATGSEGLWVMRPPVDEGAAFDRGTCVAQGRKYEQKRDGQQELLLHAGAMIRVITSGFGARRGESDDSLKLPGHCKARESEVMLRAMNSTGNQSGLGSLNHFCLSCFHVYCGHGAGASR